MTPLALLFLIVSWTCVLGLTTWCFAKVMGAGEKRKQQERAAAEGKR